MFKLKENYGVDRRFLKCDDKRHSPAEASAIITAKSQICTNIPRGDSVVSFLNSYPFLNFEDFKKTDISRFINGIDIRLINQCPIALISFVILKKSPGKHLEDFNHAHLAFKCIRR